MTGEIWFAEQIDALQKQFEALRQRAEVNAPEQSAVLADALEELGTALEELHVSAEELRQQNEELVAANHAVAAERQRYQELFEFAPDGYLVTDTAGIIREANRAAESLLNRRWEFLIGKPLAVFVAEAARPAFRTQLSQLAAGGKPVREWELHVQPHEAAPCVAAITVAAVHDPDGQRTGLRWLVRDVTERRRRQDEIARLNEDLRQGVAQLEAANKELDAFCHSLSHDLRTPLRSIDGFSHAVLESYSEQLGPQGQQHLERVRAASQRMGQLIDDLLELSRVTHRPLRRGRVDLSALGRAVASELQRAQPDRQVTFIIADGVTAAADPDLLHVVLEHLLGNAWKFTAPQPQACIEVGASGPAYFVRDNGVGFDMAYAGKLFGIFQRLHDPTEFAGTGIGLATVQRIIQRHGGRIWADAAVGRGAAFWFTL